MSFLSNGLGLQNHYQAQGTGVVNSATKEQADQLYGQTQQGIAQQQAFANAVGAQNGLQNQSDVYNQLQGIAAGTGPNPAQAMLAQATGANTANQAALMASQRGAGANTGLIARQAAQQGAANQQNAAGQAATMQANQSLNAIGQAGNIAGQQVGNQANAITGLNQATQSAQANTLNAIAGQNNANVAMQSNINNTNAGISAQNQKMNGQIVGGLIGGAGSAAGAAAGGGMVKYADGGSVAPGGYASNAARFLYSSADSRPQPTAPAAAPAMNDEAPVAAGITGLGAGLGKAVRRGKTTDDDTTAPTQLQQDNAAMMGGPSMMAKGGRPVVGEQLAASGMKVPGKASVKGNSYANDTVSALLSPGEVVIPRSVMNSKDPAKNAAKFVAAVLAKQNMKKRK